MTWFDVIKIVSYDLKQVKKLFLNPKIVFNLGDNTDVIIGLFKLIYFDEPLTVKTRMQMKRNATKPLAKIETSKFLNNLSIAGGKIINIPEKMLPLERHLVSLTSLSIYNVNDMYTKKDIELIILINDKKQCLFELRINDSLFRFKLSQRQIGYISQNLMYSIIDDILDFYRNMGDINFTFQDSLTGKKAYSFREAGGFNLKHADIVVLGIPSKSEYMGKIHDKFTSRKPKNNYGSTDDTTAA